MGDVILSGCEDSPSVLKHAGVAHVLEHLSEPQLRTRAYSAFQKLLGQELQKKVA